MIELELDFVHFIGGWLHVRLPKYEMKDCVLCWLGQRLCYQFAPNPGSQYFPHNNNNNNNNKDFNRDYKSNLKRVYKRDNYSIDIKCDLKECQ